VVAEVRLHVDGRTNQTASDERGYFELPWPQGGVPSLSVSAPGYQAAWLPQLVDPPRDNLWLDALGTCLVVPRESQRLADNVLLELWKLDGHPVAAVPDREQSAPVNKPAVIEDLEPGLYLISAYRLFDPALYASPGAKLAPSQQGRAWCSGVLVESHKETRVELDLPPLLPRQFEFLLSAEDSEPCWLELWNPTAGLTSGTPRSVLATPLLGKSAGADLIYSNPEPLLVFPGPLRAAVLTAWGSREEFEVTADARGFVPLEPLRPPASLTGQIKDEFQQPVRALIAVVRADRQADLAVFSGFDQATLLSDWERYLALDRQTRQPPSPVQWTLSFANGSYALPRVPADEPLVAMAWPLEFCGYRTSSAASLESAQMAAPWPQVRQLDPIAPGSSKALNFELFPGRLHAVKVVMSGGKPVAKGVLLPRLQGKGESVQPGQTIPSGASFASVLPLPAVKLDAQGLGYLHLPLQACSLEVRSPGAQTLVVPYFGLDGRIRPGSATQSVELFPAVRLDGHVVDLEGVAIAAALVQLRQPDRLLSTRTGAQGEYTFEEAAPGAASLEASGFALHAGPDARISVNTAEGWAPHLVLKRMPLPRYNTLRGSVGSDDGRKHVPGLSFVGAGSQSVLSFHESGYVLSGVEPKAQQLSIHAPWHLPMTVDQVSLNRSLDHTLDPLNLVSLVRICLWPSSGKEALEWEIRPLEPTNTSKPKWWGAHFEPRGQRAYAFAPRWPCRLLQEDGSFAFDLDLSPKRPASEDLPSLAEPLALPPEAGEARHVAVQG
jgi:hypothetical protein